MKITKFLSIAAVAAMMVACGGNKTDETQDSIKMDDSSVAVTVMDDASNQEDTEEETVADEAKSSQSTGQKTTETKTTKAEEPQAPANNKETIKQKGSAAVKEVVEGTKEGIKDATDKMTEKLENAKAKEASATEEVKDKVEEAKNALRKNR